MYGFGGLGRTLVIVWKKQNKKIEKIVAKRVQVLITMLSCLQLVIALPVVVQALTQPRMSEIQRKNQIIKTVKRNLDGFLDLNNLSHFFKPFVCGKKIYAKGKIFIDSYLYLTISNRNSDFVFFLLLVQIIQ